MGFINYAKHFQKSCFLKFYVIHRNSGFLIKDSLSKWKTVERGLGEAITVDATHLQRIQGSDE